jgi:multidrug transporter EmrE-like cation transporter
MGYLILVVAIAIEVGATIALRVSDGFSRLGYGIGAIAGYGVSLWLLSQAMRSVPLSISYTLWAGVGTAGALVAAMVLFGERLAPIQWLGVGGVLIGVAFLNAPKVVS